MKLERRLWQNVDKVLLIEHAQLGYLCLKLIELCIKLSFVRFFLQAGPKKNSAPTY